MRELIRPSSTTYEKAYTLTFVLADDPGSGFSFPCDRYGNVDETKLSSAARENLHACQTGRVEGNRVSFECVEEETIANTENAIIRCDCGHLVELVDWWASECLRCGREYNGGGQLLAPRSQWGSGW